MWVYSWLRKQAVWSVSRYPLSRSSGHRLRFTATVLWPGFDAECAEKGPSAEHLLPNGQLRASQSSFFFFFFSWQFGKLLLPANMMALTSGLNQPRRAPKRPVPWHCTKLLIWKAFLFHPVWGKISENELWPLLLGAIIFTKKLPTQWSNYCVSSSYLSLKVHKRVSHLERVLNT